MYDEEPATLEGQFYDFARFVDTKRSGTTITLYQSDYWMRQAGILDDRKVTMTDTGILFNEYRKSEITFEEWEAFLSKLCAVKELDEETTKKALTNCGIPGTVEIKVPRYRDFFQTYNSKEKRLH